MSVKVTPGCMTVYLASGTLLDSFFDLPIHFGPPDITNSFPRTSSVLCPDGLHVIPLVFAVDLRGEEGDYYVRYP